MELFVSSLFPWTLSLVYSLMTRPHHPKLPTTLTLSRQLKRCVNCWSRKRKAAEFSLKTWNLAFNRTFELFSHLHFCRIQSGQFHQGGCVFTLLVGWLVGLSAWLQKTFQQITKKLCGRTGHGPRKNPLHFGVDPGYFFLGRHFSS